ncbi:MAG: hypothetical protein Q4Q42_08045, partial [Planctomycetia bacterium]|nr:hypothetical protein [Planctomycetia bacterium]
MKPNERDWNNVESISDVVKEKVTLIREKIAEAEIKSGRSPNSVKLIAVSKYAQPDDGIVSSFLKSNLTDLAENRVKNFLEKVSFWGNQYIESASPLPQSSWGSVEGERTRKDINWHFIGNLQRNKVRRVLPYVSLIHSVDSWNLLETIERIVVEEETKEASTSTASFPNCVSVLLEAHISEDSTKQGFDPQELLELFPRMEERFPHIRFRGLMGMGGLHASPTELRRQFALLRSL